MADWGDERNQMRNQNRLFCRANWAKLPSKMGDFGFQFGRNCNAKCCSPVGVSCSILIRYHTDISLHPIDFGYSWFLFLKKNMKALIPDLGIIEPFHTYFIHTFFPLCMNSPCCGCATRCPCRLYQALSVVSLLTMLIPVGISVASIYVNCIAGASAQRSSLSWIFNTWSFA